MAKTVENQESPTKHHIIIDTDMAYDDWLAILFLLGRKDVEILAISVCGTGESRPDAGVSNMLKILHAVNKQGIPVSAGPLKPLKGNNSFPKQIRDQIDSMLGIELSEPKQKPDPRDAVTLMKDSLLAAREPVTLFTLGPLTNIALLLKKHPETRPHIKQVFCMGGAIHVEWQCE